MKPTPVKLDGKKLSQPEIDRLIKQIKKDK
jgi:hypothetical protein